MKLAFLWHLHQPLYRLQGEKVCFLPWVRLHAVRSYYDMVRVLDEFPDLRMTFNLTPVLIEQIRAYAEGSSDLFRETGALPAEDLDETQRAFIVDHFFSAQEERMIGALPRFADLLERRDRARRLRGPADAWKEFPDADLRDLQALFDLSWFGFKACEDFPELAALRERGMGYTREDLAAIHAVEAEILRRVLPLYREAARSGRIEISTSPYAHPILPLLIDTDSAREAMPRAELPPRMQARPDARTQIEEGLDLVERELGVRPRGMWPSEGAVSQEAAELMAACGVAWAASDEQVLAASDLAGTPDPYRPWEIGAAAPGLSLIFRDHDLSDRIGFTYARSNPAEAIESFITAVCGRGQDGGLVLIALDGENPWEQYADAGAPFLRALYGALQNQPALGCETVGAAIHACTKRGSIRRLRAGSWIHGDLGTWIGGPEKNRAWSLLTHLRSGLTGALLDPAVPEPRRQRAWRALRAAEGSDWFWWLDRQHSSLYRSQFDQAFRGHLRQACEALELPVPDLLNWPIPSPEQSVEGEAPGDAGSWIEPHIDGFEGDYFEWSGAPRLSWNDISSASSMQRGRREVESMRYGFSRAGDFFLRLDPEARAIGIFADLTAELAFRLGARTLQIRLALDAHGNLREAGVCRGRPEDDLPCTDFRPCAVRAAARKILEIEVSAAELALPPGQSAGLRVYLKTAGGEVSLREIGLRVPPAGAAAAEPVHGGRR